MIYELVNNGTHNNAVALYKCYCGNRSFYKKVAFTKKTNDIIENEYKGYKWFSKNTNKNISVNLIKKYFYELDIPEFMGNSFPANNRQIKGNEWAIKAIIYFYKTTWPRGDNFFIHGDMCISNFIIDGDRDMNLVDWEHFHRSDIKYYGFDIINMIFISLSYEYKNVSRLSKNTIDFLRECYSLLFDGVTDDNCILKKPFTRSSEYLVMNNKKFGLNVDIKQKFVLAKHSQSELEQLDYMITKNV